MSPKLAMIALGGNALLRAGEKGSFSEQLENVERTCENLLPLLERGYRMVIGHGNGPQVGNGLLRQEAGKQLFGLEAMPMDFCGAETQGSIAYLIETGMERVLHRAGISRKIVSLVTRVEVAEDDPMFLTPTKPVGPYYPSAEGRDGVFREDPQGRGWRKVVASPQPVRIHNLDLAGRLAREGYLVVTVGGGGIPVVREEGGCRGVEAVIDKDLACALAAIQMQADELYILTDVPKVYLHFRTPQQQALDTLTVSEARAYLSEGMFTEGSMAPKVRAGIRFAEQTHGRCIITDAQQLSKASCGTQIIA